jgi:predicted ATPase
MVLAAKPYLQRVELDYDSIEVKEEYPFNIPAIHELFELTFHPDVTFFVGENGSGKSTLLEAIAIGLGFGAEGGTKNMQFQTAHTVSQLYRYLKFSKSFKKPRDYFFLRAESFYNVATYADEVGYLDGYGKKSLHARSHGESFMTLLLSKFRGNGLYLLDEPEAALSPSRQLAALSAIHHLVEDGSQFVIATHSPILLAYPRSKIVLFDGSGLTETAYEDTEHYAVTRDFLNNYPRRTEQLLAPDDEAE